MSRTIRLLTESKVAVAHQVWFNPDRIAAWQADCDRYVPPHPGLSRLLVRWHAGDPWAKVERVVLWQLWPDGMAPMGAEMLKALHGPHPRSTGHYCSGSPDDNCYCPIPRKRWVGGTTRLVTRDQWEIFRETGCYAERWWCVQGDGGGHRLTLSPAEQALAHARGIPLPLPKMGALPFAEPDQRTWEYQRAYDQLWAWQAKETRSFAKRNVKDIEKAEQVVAEKAAHAQMDLLAEQVEGFWSDGGGKLLKQHVEETYGRLGWRDKRQTIDGDVSEAQYVQSVVHTLT
jgi:hypothetical protein